MNYSHENTILIWDGNPAILADVKKVCHSLKLSIYKADKLEDVLAVPYFFAVVDGTKLSNEFMTDLIEVIGKESEKEFAILLTKPTTSQIPAKLKKYIILPIEVINFDYLKTNIFNKRFALMRHKKNKRKYDKTLYRLMNISYKLRTKRKYVYLSDLCAEFFVTERTIKRDFSLLEEMGEDIQYDRIKNGYFLEFSRMEIEFKEHYD
jgi:hypothetical protein